MAECTLTIPAKVPTSLLRQLVDKARRQSARSASRRGSGPTAGLRLSGALDLTTATVTIGPLKSTYDTFGAWATAYDRPGATAGEFMLHGVVEQIMIHFEWSTAIGTLVTVGAPTHDLVNRWTAPLTEFVSTTPPSTSSTSSIQRRHGLTKPEIPESGQRSMESGAPHHEVNPELAATDDVNHTRSYRRSFVHKFRTLVWSEAVAQNVTGGIILMALLALGVWLRLRFG